MKFYFTLLWILCATFLSAQTVAGFEEFNLPAESFRNGKEGKGGFTSGPVFLPNDYNTDFMSWSGWAISNKTDKTTPGFMNQYSAITGKGVNGSRHYAVNYAFGNNNMILRGDAAGKPVSGMYITNSTYAYLSMKEGDAFAKKFGGATGDDRDFFLLTIKAFSNGVPSIDSVNFYLADYRFKDNREDYIVDEWTWVNLSPLGSADSLSFTLTSSDMGRFGMNTPAFFCVDDVFANAPIVSSTRVNVPDVISVYPNPTADFIQISHSLPEGVDCSIYDASGRLLLQQKIYQKDEQINIQNLPAGNYVVNLRGKQAFLSKIVVKK